MAGTKLCSGCGCENRHEAAFCDQCGTRLISGAVPRFGSPESYTPAIAATTYRELGMNGWLERLA